MEVDAGDGGVIRNLLCPTHTQPAWGARGGPCVGQGGALCVPSLAVRGENTKLDIGQDLCGVCGGVGWP